MKGNAMKSKWSLARRIYVAVWVAIAQFQAAREVTS